MRSVASHRPSSPLRSSLAHIPLQHNHDHSASRPQVLRRPQRPHPLCPDDPPSRPLPGHFLLDRHHLDLYPADPGLYGLQTFSDPHLPFRSLDRSQADLNSSREDRRRTVNASIGIGIEIGPVVLEEEEQVGDVSGM